ncbi:MAG TPA: hypothetical protein VIX87_11715 [Steroidobacteraceae bacterium]
MSRRSALAVLAGVALLAVAALALHPWHLYAPPGPRVVVGGGDAGGLARTEPAEEHIDGAALERATTDVSAARLQAFVVMRDNHLVFERYARGVTGDSVIDGGTFARVLVALAAGLVSERGALPPRALRGFDPEALREGIESATSQRYEVYLSRELWSRLNAAPAWIALPAPGGPTPAQCCFHARVLDWMRVATLLVDDGRFEGKQLVPPDWVRRIARPVSADLHHGFGVELAAAAHGAEPFAADGVFFARGPGRWRLWLVPSLRLAVLFGAQAPASAGPAPWDETRLPNLVIRAVSDGPQPPGDATPLQRLVPGH